MHSVCKSSKKTFLHLSYKTSIRENANNDLCIQNLFTERTWPSEDYRCVRAHRKNTFKGFRGGKDIASFIGDKSYEFDIRHTFQRSISNSSIQSRTSVFSGEISPLYN